MYTSVSVSVASEVPCISEVLSPGCSRRPALQQRGGGPAAPSQLVLHSFLVVVLLQVRLLRLLQILQVLGGGRPGR